jgi:hypothetical protein
LNSSRGMLEAVPAVSVVDPIHTTLEPTNRGVFVRFYSCYLKTKLEDIV